MGSGHGPGRKRLRLIKGMNLFARDRGLTALMDARGWGPERCSGTEPLREREGLEGGRGLSDGVGDDGLEEGFVDVADGPGGVVA